MAARGPFPPWALQRPGPRRDESREARGSSGTALLFCLAGRAMLVLRCCSSLRALLVLRVMNAML